MNTSGLMMVSQVCGAPVQVGREALHDRFGRTLTWLPVNQRHGSNLPEAGDVKASNASAGSAALLALRGKEPTRIGWFSCPHWTTRNRMNSRSDDRPLLIVPS